MSTRTNVIIKKEGQEMKQLYHHHDGYPEGVGADLHEYLHNLSEDDKKKAIESTDFLYTYLPSIKNDEYEAEPKVCLHGDIEFLYVIDLDDETISCHSVWCWDDSADDDIKKINGTYPQGKNYKTYYSLSMWTTPDEFEVKLKEMGE